LLSALLRPSKTPQFAAGEQGHKASTLLERPEVIDLPVPGTCLRLPVAFATQTGADTHRQAADREDPDPPRDLACPSPQSARRSGGLSLVLHPFLCRVNRARVRCRADQSADRVGAVCVRSPACAAPGFRLTPSPRLAYPYQREFQSAIWRESSAAGGGARVGIVARRARKTNPYRLASPHPNPYHLQVQAFPVSDARVGLA